MDAKQRFASQEEQEAYDFVIGKVRETRLAIQDGKPLDTAWVNDPRVEKVLESLKNFHEECQSLIIILNILTTHEQTPA